MAKQSKNSKSNSKIINGVDAVGSVARSGLERFGSLLDSLNAKSGKASQFKAVDLSEYKNSTANNLLSQQTIKTSEQLLGSRFTTYSKYAKKVVPDSLFQKASDSAFSQVAKLAANWSEVDLPGQQRFKGTQALTDQERNALARDIANQNRALATIGGVTGLAGLPGMLADTLWLLLVSLRTVYQLAIVYDKPLTGKQGIKMAYAVIGSADLSKMQEKQTILATLGVAKGLVNSADNSGLRSELTKGLGIANPNVQFYAQQVDKLAEQFNFDLDGINLGWMSKFIPLLSVATTVHYNSHLIDQVIGVAKATFGPEPIMAKQALADQANSEKSDDQKNSANEDESAKDTNKKDDSTKDESKSADKSEKTDKNEQNQQKQAEADKEEQASDKESADKETAAKKSEEKAETEEGSESPKSESKQEQTSQKKDDQQDTSKEADSKSNKEQK
ncbi:EcsC family protein [Psychrobacter sanguinis]|uniref:EcsC family protein n=1 Tax=Psychrobacter sanguinis TaxID=861445 RepID=UPI00191855D3|nr:EcsC family protein [Psychrobacter sanguinis]MCC3308482.1 EcsC family protein [Psychrobacter sanguinis]UEC25778.1 EcsC family protein [Psychrobacter sanguinis]